MKQLKFIQIPNGHYAVIRNGKIYDLELKSFSIMQSLVTIEEYLEWYEGLGIGTMSLGFRVVICGDMSWRSELISL